jgi:drug/metabolite transporter (DMT)-like permease
LPDAARSEDLRRTWLRLNVEQRVAGVGALLLIASTLGPFSFVEVAQLLVAGGVLLLLRQRAEGRQFHLPFGDGTVILAAGCWAAFLILVRLFDRPLGQGLLALACAVILIAAGIRERAKRPPDDLPPTIRLDPRGERDADAPNAR